MFTTLHIQEDFFIYSILFPKLMFNEIAVQSKAKLSANRYTHRRSQGVHRMHVHPQAEKK